MRSASTMVTLHGLQALECMLVIRRSQACKSRSSPPPAPLYTGLLAGQSISLSHKHQSEPEHVSGLQGPRVRPAAGPMAQRWWGRRPDSPPGLPCSPDLVSAIVRQQQADATLEPSFPGSMQSCTTVQPATAASWDSLLARLNATSLPSSQQQGQGAVGAGQRTLPELGAQPLPGA